jgi:protein O-mannosyl-transferase
MKNAWRSPGFDAALLLLLTVVAFAPAIRGGFLWDDDVLITQNQMIKAGDGLYRFWFTTEATEYYPVTWSCWWLEWRLWDGKATGYHVLNVFLHAINAVLVWMILRRLNIPAAWLAAAVFAIHPVNVATVAWISAQKNTISMLFYALSILWYLRYDDDGRRRWYGLSLGAFVVALLSKTAVVMLPVVLLGCLWWRHGRIQRKDLLRSLPFFTVSLVMGLVNIWFEYHRAMGGQPIRTAALASRLDAAGWVPWFYLSKALAPIDLMVIYPKWEVDATRWVSYVPGILLIACFVIFWCRRQTWGRPLLFGLGYFVVTLFPVWGLFDQPFYRYSLVADHWQYYSIIGVITLVVALARRVGNRMGDWRRPVGVPVIVATLLVLGVTTWKRSCLYANNETLWQDNVTRNPAAEVAHYNLAVVLELEGRIHEAIGHFEEALRLKPDSVDTHNNLGAALWKVGRTQEAIRHYELALQYKPDSAEAHYNLGIALKQEGKLMEAIRHYELALEARSDYAEAHYNLGNSLWQAGRMKDAIEQYEQAVRIKPDYIEAHYNLGIALEQAGKVAEAIEQYEQVVRLKPDYAEAQQRLTGLQTAR